MSVEDAAIQDSLHNSRSRMGTSAFEQALSRQAQGVSLEDLTANTYNGICNNEYTIEFEPDPSFCIPPSFSHQLTEENCYYNTRLHVLLATLKFPIKPIPSNLVDAVLNDLADFLKQRRTTLHFPLQHPQWIFNPGEAAMANWYYWKFTRKSWRIGTSTFLKPNLGAMERTLTLLCWLG